MQEKTIDFYETVMKRLKVSIKKEENEIRLFLKEGGLIKIHLLPKKGPKKRLIDYFKKTRSDKNMVEITEEKSKKVLLNSLTDLLVSKRQLISIEEEFWKKIENDVWEEIRDDIMKTRRFFYESIRKNTYAMSVSYFIIESKKEGVLK